MTLKQGTTLQGGKYIIKKVLGQGGFGITYLAEQEMLDRKVAIKEFFFKEYCVRNNENRITVAIEANKLIVERFLNKFIKEAKTISKLQHPNIIQIYDIFRENSTAYYVMEYVEGETLQNLVDRRGMLPESEVITYAREIGKALSYIHERNINHLDIKPANLLLRQRDNQIIIIDFGTSKGFDIEGDATTTTPVGVSHGYAPLEQYSGISYFSPESDIYSLGATIYKLLTGKTPMRAGKKQIPLPSSVSPIVRCVVEKSMQIMACNRFSSISDFLSQWDGYTSPDADWTGVYAVNNKVVEATRINISEDAFDTLMKLTKEEIYSIKEEEIRPYLSILKAESNNGNAVAQYILGNCYYIGKGVTQDYLQAVEWYIRSAKQGNSDAQWSLANCYYDGVGVVQDYVLADKWFRKSVEQENTDAQCSLSNDYKVKGMYERYQKLAERGHPDAQYKLGICYVLGEGVEQDYEQAVFWYQKSAEHGHPGAQWSLGNCYFLGKGVEQDYEQAVLWYQKSAEQGNSDAQYFLGDCYYNGEGIEQDYERAVLWYQKSAEQGNSDAQWSLGNCYYNGEGIEQDYERAVLWYQKSAEQGNSGAQWSLGNCYYIGDGINQDYERARFWYQKSAEQGNPDAQYSLGDCYEFGKGAYKDLKMAEYWYKKSSDQGHEQARESYERLLILQKPWYRRLI